MHCQKCEELQEEILQLKKDFLGIDLVDKFRVSLKLWESEAQTLAFLYRRYPHYATTELMANYLCGEASDKILDVRIYRLRNVLGTSAIETSRGSRRLSVEAKAKLDTVLAGGSIEISPRQIATRTQNIRKVLEYLNTVPYAEASILISIAPTVRLSYLFQNGWIKHVGRQQQGVPGVYSITQAGRLKCQPSQSTIVPKSPRRSSSQTLAPEKPEG